MKAKTYTLAALVLYVILGAIDFAETYSLVQRGDGTAYESNPFAASWLKDYGWRGLAIFKIAATLVVTTTVLIILRYRQRTAAVVATLACISVLAVAVYSRNLMKLQEDPSGGQRNVPVRVEND
jgi:hypothetical protein